MKKNLFYPAVFPCIPGNNLPLKKRNPGQLIKKCFLLFSFLWSFIPLFCQQTVPQQIPKTVSSSNAPEGQIGFLEYTPMGYNASGTELHPLIIFFHGKGGEGNGVSQINKVATSAAGSIAWYCADPANGNNMTFTVNGQTSSFVVLSPQLSSSYTPDANLYWRNFYITEMIAYAKTNLRIDPNRIYVTGLSLGGQAAWNAGKDATIRTSVAAIAPVASINAFISDVDPTDFCTTIAANHVPLWAFSTVGDNYSYSPTHHAQDFANSCSMTPTPKFTFYRDAPNGDAHSTTWINAYNPNHIPRYQENGLQVTDNPNLYEWLLTQSLGNTAPSVNAGANQIIVLPTSTTTLNGTASGTNGASIVARAWTKISGPAGGAIASPTTLSTGISALVQGVYKFRLTVTDNHNLTASSDVTVTVNTAGNQPPVSIAGPDAIITLPTNTVTLDGSASYDPDGTIVAYYWEQLTGPSTAVIANNTASITTAFGLVQGVYTFRLHVRDNGTVVSLSTAKTVTVNPATGNQAPVSIAGANAIITLPTNTVALNGSASYDPDGTIVAYYWEQLTGPSTSVIANNTASITTASGLVQGVYTFRLHVRDNIGVVSLSAAKTVTVNPNGTRVAVQATTSGDAALMQAAIKPGLALYPNPVQNNTVIELNSAENTASTIQLYNTTGKLAGRYNWRVVKGKNIFSLKNMPGLAKGLYMIDIRNANGQPMGGLKFIKL